MTKEEIALEIAEKTDDLEVFIRARDILYNRIIYVQDHSVSKVTPLHEWSGAHAIMNTLDIVIHSMERMLGELKALTPQEVRPQLKLVKNEDS